MNALALVLGVLAIGCGGSSPTPVEPVPEPAAQKPAGPACEAMAGHLATVMARDDQQASAGEIDQLVAVYKLRCGEDRWTDAARQCYGTIQVGTDVEGCGKLLTPEQKTSFDRALAASVEREKANQDALLQRFEQFAEQACKCKPGDHECAKKVSDDMTKWAESQAADAVPLKRDPRIEPVAEKLSQCITTTISAKPEPAPPAKTKQPGK